jgi:hypothetical protein
MVKDTLERYLQPDVVLREVYAKMVPNLQFIELVKPIREDKPTFPYKYNSYSMSSDPKKETAPVAMAGARFPELDYTRESIGSKATEEHGFQMRLKHDLMKHRGSKAMQEVTGALERAGFWMAETINSEILTGMKTSGNYTSITWATTTWDDASATPIADLRTAKKTFRHAGYPYRLNTVLAHLDNWTELQGYVQDYDNRWLVGGVPGITEDTITIPSLQMVVHCVDDGLTDFAEGSMIGLDKNNVVAEWHYYNDALFSPQRVTYQTIEADGKKVSKTVNNLGIHFRRLYDEDLDDIVLQFYYDAKLTVTNAYGIDYGTGV